MLRLEKEAWRTELFYAVYSVCTLEINCSWYALIGYVSSTYRIICNKRRAYSNREATDFSLFSTMVLLLNKGRMRKTVTRFVKTGLRMVRRSKRKILRDRCDYAKHCARERVCVWESEKERERERQREKIEIWSTDRTKENCSLSHCCSLNSRTIKMFDILSWPSAV